MIDVGTLHIRTASRADAAALAELSHQTFVETFADKNSEENMAEYLSNNCTEKILADELGDSQSVFFVADWDGAFVGFAKLRRGEIPEETGKMRTIEIQRLYVIKKMIGKKIGRALMQKCMETAKNEKFEFLWLGVWEHNQVAMEFYKRFGFEIFGSQIFELGKDKQTDLLMRRTVLSVI